VAEPIVLNTIERLGRALFATLAPATGARARGQIYVTNSSDDEIAVPPNTYLLPVVGGQLRHDLVFKTTRPTNPDESSPGGGGADVIPTDWIIPAGSAREIAIMSNVGGVRHNLPSGTIFRFDPPFPGLAATAPLVQSTQLGSDAGALIRSVAFYEDLESGSPSKDLFDAKVGEAGVLLTWTQSEPVEGSMGGLRQGGNRATRASRIWREHYTLFVVASRLSGDSNRRQDGHVILQAITRLLTDRHQNDDGEQLSTIGAGVEITHRARISRNERVYLYGMQLRTNQTLEPAIDTRTFERWTTTHYEGAVPGREMPEPIQDLEVVDAVDPMP